MIHKLRKLPESIQGLVVAGALGLLALAVVAILSLLT